MPTALKLIAGLGNPGPQYADTRHNVGADWVRELARAFQIPLTLDTKFKAEIGLGSVLGHDVRLLIPVTYMNHSGDAIGAARYVCVCRNVGMYRVSFGIRFPDRVLGQASKFHNDSVIRVLD